MMYVLLCGQAIPEHQLEEARDKALKAFNLNKSQRLEDITEKGKIAAQELEETKEQDNGLLGECTQLRSKLD